MVCLLIDNRLFICVDFHKLVWHFLLITFLIEFTSNELNTFILNTIRFLLIIHFRVAFVIDACMWMFYQYNAIFIEYTFSTRFR